MGGLKNGLKETWWCVRASDPSPPQGEKKGERREETLTLHYLCLVLLVQADVASHCVFIMRNCYEAKEEETQPADQCVLVCVSL